MVTAQPLVFLNISQTISIYFPTTFWHIKAKQHFFSTEGGWKMLSIKRSHSVFFFSHRKTQNFEKQMQMERTEQKLQIDTM